jgi:CHAT domain-containing protein/Tfp pilus assembly protein PilF
MPVRYSRFSIRAVAAGACSIIAFFGLLTAAGSISAIPPQQSGQSPVPADASKQPPAQPRVLTPGASIEDELVPGQKRVFQISVTEAQYATLIVEQRGIDVLIDLLGPDGKRIYQVDSTGPQESEKAEVIDQPPGDYRLVVAPANAGATAGRFVIRFVELRACTQDERSLQEARRLQGQSFQLMRSGKYDDAVPPGERALEIRERILGVDHLDVAASLYHLGEVYRHKGDQQKAASLAQRAIDIREKKLGPEHPEVANALNSLASILRTAGNFSAAEPLLQRALQIKEKTLGPDNLELAVSVNSLAILYSQMGDYPRAEPLFLRALQIREKRRGPDSPEVAGSLNNLANLYWLLGDLVKSERYYERSIEIKEKILGSEHPDVALSLNNLAAVLRDRGDLVKAEQLYNRAIRIREKALGPNHPDVAASYTNLAVTLRDKGEFARGEELQKRALEIQTKALGPDHPDVAGSLNNLAELYRLSGHPEKVEPLFQRALEIQLKALGPDHPEVAMSLTGLGSHYADSGNYDRAEPMLKRALEISEKALGPGHPQVGTTVNSLAALYASKGEIAKAVATQTRANGIIEHNIVLNLVTGSERQKLAYLGSLSQSTDQTLSLHIRTAPESAEARDLAATTILQRKGRVFDAMADSVTTLRARSSAEDQKLLDRLKETTSQLAALVLNGPQQTKLDQHLGRINSLEQQREKLESEIGVRSAGFYNPTKPVSLAAVQSAIPADAALIEFAIYHPSGSRAGQKQPENRDARYVAYIVPARGEIKWKELGNTQTIDRAADQLREALRDPNRNDIRQLARHLDEQVMQPLRVLAGTATHLIVSPEGALNLIPFEALFDEQQRYLVERYSISYLTGGRDLLRMQIARPSRNTPMVMADPWFGEAEIARTERLPAARSRRESQGRRSITSADDLSTVYFAPLAGTEREAIAIKSLFPEAAILTRQQATESALKRVEAPAILHIATHGFFLRGKDDLPSPAGNGVNDTRAISATTTIENPLLRSGLALAGANIRNNNSDDGILTALEASSLNLWGTKLVTLSACDTGLGAVKTGEGVYGLRRAFALGGAETLVMSLWPVSDYVTRELMTAYYGGLKRGAGRGEALRQVQLDMLKLKSRRHPFYWASFIQYGEWANLTGKR